jgi:hypothetical protein
MPFPLVFVTVKPLIVIQLLLDTVKPFTVPVSVTVAPGAAVKTIGAADVPEVGTVTSSGYVPAATWTVSPAATRAAAAPIVQNGWSTVPEPVSEHAGLPLSTYSTGFAAALSEPGSSPKTSPASSGPTACPQNCVVFSFLPCGKTTRPWGRPSVRRPGFAAADLQCRTTERESQRR